MRAVLPLLPWLGSGGCMRPPCTPPDYSVSECRVQAENELARALTVDGVEVRLQDPRSASTRSWEALGLVTPVSEGQVRVRVSTLGDFRLSVHRGDAAIDSLLVELTNVHPLVAPIVGEGVEQIEHGGLTRVVEVDLTGDADVVEVRGTLAPEACDGGFSLAAVGDIQTGPLTFQRIVEDLHRELADQAAAGTPLLGLLLLGDLAEFGTQMEFDRVAEILDRSPVPIAITPGNHDIFATAQPMFNQTFGPGNHAFDVCDARIVMLDTGNGDLATSVQAWLPRLLDGPLGPGSSGPHRPRFLVAGTHMPPYAGYTTDGWRREDQAQHLMAELASRDADLMVTGHVHWRGEFDQAPVREVVVGTGGASQRGVDPDYGYLRAVFPPRGDLDVCFVSLPAPGSPGPPPRRAPIRCGPR